MDFINIVLQVEIHYRGYLVLTACFYKRLHHRFIDIPSPDRRIAFALSSNYLESR